MMARTKALWQSGKFMGSLMCKYQKGQQIAMLEFTSVDFCRTREKVSGASEVVQMDRRIEGDERFCDEKNKR